MTPKRQMSFGKQMVASENKTVTLKMCYERVICIELANYEPASLLKLILS